MRSVRGERDSSFHSCLRAPARASVRIVLIEIRLIYRFYLFVFFFFFIFPRETKNGGSES